MSKPTAKLFQPTKVGDLDVKHRVVLAPLTRIRANAQHVHGDLAVEYYRQHASEPSTLMVTEGTFIAGKAGGMPHVPGIWNSEQLAAWKKVLVCFICLVSYGLVLTAIFHGIDYRGRPRERLVHFLSALGPRACWRPGGIAARRL